MDNSSRSLFERVAELRDEGLIPLSSYTTRSVVAVGLLGTLFLLRHKLSEVLKLAYSQDNLSVFEKSAQIGVILAASGALLTITAIVIQTRFYIPKKWLKILSPLRAPFRLTFVIVVQLLIAVSFATIVFWSLAPHTFSLINRTSNEVIQWALELRKRFSLTFVLFWLAFAVVAFCGAWIRFILHYVVNFDKHQKQ